MHSVRSFHLYLILIFSLIWRQFDRLSLFFCVHFYLSCLKCCWNNFLFNGHFRFPPPLISRPAMYCFTIFLVIWDRRVSSPVPKYSIGLVTGRIMGRIYCFGSVKWKARKGTKLRERKKNDGISQVSNQQWYIYKTNKTILLLQLSLWWYLW